METTEAIPLESLPKDQQVSGKLPAKQSVKIDDITTRTEKMGALGINNFNRIRTREDPSVAATNAYQRHKQDNVIGFATYVPSNEKGRDNPLTFRSADGTLRVINSHESVPVYFAADWQDLKTKDTVRLSEEPLDREVLAKEFRYATLQFEELAELAQSLRVWSEKPGANTRQETINRLLVVEFGEPRVKANIKKQAA